MANSRSYSLLVSDLHNPRIAKLRRSRTRTAAVPEGHLPVYVGDEMCLFIISADLVNHPIFVNLLTAAADEYGYDGVLRIPCHVIVFERVLEGLRVVEDSVRDLLELS